MCAIWIVVLSSAAHAGTVGSEGNLDDTGHTTVGIVVEGPGVGKAGRSGAGSSRPVIDYGVTWSVDPVPAAVTGSLDGACAVPGGVGAGAFGFKYHFVGRDAAGTIVDDRYVCVPFTTADRTQPPPVPAAPAVPTFAEVWNAIQLPAPVVVLDPAGRGITGLETRITTSGPTTAALAATLDGYTVTGTATLDHYEIRVDGGAPIDGADGRFTFETKGKHTVAISAVWAGVATLGGGLLANPIGPSDIGTATITSTRTYQVNEIRSVLQP